MTTILDIARRTALYLLPPLTSVVGVGLADLSADFNRLIRVNEAVALTAAALAPLLAVLLLTALNQRFDHILVTTAGMLTSIGTTTLFSLSLTQEANAAFYQAVVNRHSYFVCGGFLALVAGARLSHHLDRIRKFPFTLLTVALLLTLATMTFGETVNGARSWLRAGPVQFQPSEVARLFLVGFVAIYLYDRRHLVAAPWRVATLDLPPAPYLAPLVGAIMASVAVLVLQNDLGMAALIVLGAYASVAAVLSSRWALGLAGATLAVSAIASFVVSPRVRERVVAWLEPWYDPADRGFQFVQAEFAMAGGGILGNAAAKAPGRVPEVHTDFILVAIATEWGWVGAAAVLTLIGLVVCRCLEAALRATDGFRSLLGLGTTALLGIQVLLICGGTIRVLPLTGVTLPLVSYGGTSMVATLFALGVVSGIGASDEA